jgi:hypothetical protein
LYVYVFQIAVCPFIILTRMLRNICVTNDHGYVSFVVIKIIHYPPS